jgi:hypothetical protein
MSEPEEDVARALELFGRFVESQESIAELFSVMRERDERLIAQRDEELAIRRAELQQRDKEYERMDRWRAEDLEIRQQDITRAEEREQGAYDRLWGRRDKEEK